MQALFYLTNFAVQAMACSDNNFRQASDIGLTGAEVCDAGPEQEFAFDNGVGYMGFTASLNSR